MLSAMGDVRRGVGVTVMGGSVATCASIAALAERRGLCSAWTAEFYDRSATVSLAAMAAATSRIALGSAIMYAFGRTPLVTVAEARDLDELSGGRFVLGLGTGTRQQVAAWHGLESSHLAPRLEELVPLLRALWRLRDGELRHEGRFYRLRLRAALPVRPPRRAELPVWVAGVNERMIEAAGRVGDGLVGHPLFTPEYVTDVVRPALARGAARAGRPEDVPVAGYVVCVVADDSAQARREAAAQVAFYAVVRAFDPILRRHGFLPEAAAIREAFRGGDVPSMIALVSDRMLDTFAVHGTPAEARDRFAARYAGLYEEPLLFFPCLGVDVGRHREGLAAVVETFSPSPAEGEGRGGGTDD
ncbi:MAG TPA: LLM class flavin-dependent oxidoreductase [Candidatus Dormibacteraeota bacterium]|nr:LLM class flavin-dependent oxidoreductase [Candidatus Dormibacteraeota bacterium]